MSKQTTWFNSGLPWIWLNGGAIALSIVMVLGLLLLIAVRGLGHFWPADIVQFEYRNKDGKSEIIMGELVRSQTRGKIWCAALWSSGATGTSAAATLCGIWNQLWVR